MTCIVGLKHEGKVYIGGDSLGSDKSFNCNVRDDVKVFKNGEFLIGFTTSFRMGQILDHVWIPPKQPETTEDMKFMVSIVIPSIIDLFDLQGFGKANGTSGVEGGEFLIGYKGELYQIYSDFQVAVNSSGIAACGCGDSYALGALYALKDTPLEPDQKLLKSLRISSILSAGVRGPFKIMAV